MWIVALLVQPAAATSCAWGPSGALPADGAVDVPPNVRPTVLYEGGASEDDIWLEDDLGNEVLAGAYLRGDTALEEEPVLALSPGLYHLVSSASGVMSSFEVAGAEDLEGPSAPSVVSVEQLHGDGGEMLAMGETHALHVVLSEATDPTGVLYEVRVSDADGVELEVQWTERLDVFLGAPLCASAAVLFPEGDLLVDVRARDAAHNWSDWSQPASIAYAEPDPEAADPEDRNTPDMTSRGCDSGGFAPSGALAALGLLLAVRRRPFKPE